MMRRLGNSEDVDEALTGPLNRYQLAHYTLQNQGEYKEARKALKLWLKEEPTNAEALFQMAGYYAMGIGVTKSYRKALEFF